MAENWNQNALIIIDMQNDFILEDGLMRVDGGKAIVPNVIKAVEIARQRQIQVIWVVREHDPLGRDVELFRRHLYSPGNIGPTSKGSRGAELVDGLVIKDGEYKVVKTRFSAFFNTNLHLFLNTEGIKDLVIVGVQTPNCIRQTAFDAVALDFLNVAVIVDATAAATPDIHAANIFDMQKIGVATPTLQQWLEVAKKTRRSPSAFMLFCEEFRKQYKKEHPENNSIVSVSKAAAEKWQSLSEAEKAPYVAKAERRKA